MAVPAGASRHVSSGVSVDVSSRHDCERVEQSSMRLWLLSVAPDETVILLHPPIPSVGVSIVMERERQQNDSLVNG